MNKVKYIDSSAPGQGGELKIKKDPKKMTVCRLRLSDCDETSLTFQCSFGHNKL